MKKSILIIFIFLVALTFFSCSRSRILTYNIWRTITESPEIVINKIDNPIKDSVRLSVLWAGHSTVLLQIYEKVLLFDPFFEDRFAFFFTRKLESGLLYENLSKLDIIFVSHSHFDHLSFHSLDELSNLFPKTNLVFPAGVEEYLPNFDLNMHRLDTTGIFSGKYYGKTTIIDDVKITPVYAVHTGGRYALDSYLWRVQGHCGFIVEYKDVSVYFAGDTGYDDIAFKKIGEKFNIELAFIPIGPCRNCEEKGFLYHTSVMEAIKLFEDIKAKKMIPIHYGTIEYMNDPRVPIYVLEKILEEEKYLKDLKDKVFILDEGEQIIY
ncbi:MAG: MBL fold metallo-hydrolase [Ignavibacteria bacterium]|nr:MBL fold metallo-hydrolase [Ignavibacteria bacterium]